MKVRCIDNKGVDLTLLKEYEIIRSYPGAYVVKDDYGYATHFNKKRFEVVEETKEDEINNPSHYTRGKIEVIDFIEDQSLNFSRGAAIKYICRAGFKGENTEVNDLKKAAWFINREIARLEKNEHVEKA